MAVPPRSLLVATLLSGALTLAACSRSDSVTSATVASTAAPTTEAAPTTTPTTAAPTTAPTTTTAPPTTEPTPTTAPPTTTPEPTAPPTTLPPALTASDIVLRADGLGPFDLSTPDAVVIAGLAEALGAPVSDDAQTYPIADGAAYLDVTEEESFVSPIGRRVCFSNGLCPQFGGATTSSLVMVGWSLSEEPTPIVATADGVTVGSPVSAFPSAITVQEGGCYTVGSGDVAGVYADILSSGLPFGEFATDGSYISRIPDLADLTIVGLSTGDLPIYLYADC